eukprot:3286787-Prymnesium_polylepis.2
MRAQVPALTSGDERIGVERVVGHPEIHTAVDEGRDAEYAATALVQSAGLTINATCSTHRVAVAEGSLRGNLHTAVLEYRRARVVTEPTGLAKTRCGCCIQIAHIDAWTAVALGGCVGPCMIWRENTFTGGFNPLLSCFLPCARLPLPLPPSHRRFARPAAVKRDGVKLIKRAVTSPRLGGTFGPHCACSTSVRSAQRRMHAASKLLILLATSHAAL